MDLVEFNTHSFIVKIWIEEPAEEHHKGRWRGHITHVPGGERRYLESLGEIVAFMVPYLLSMDVRLDAYSRLRARLSGLSGSNRSAQELKRDEEAGFPEPLGHRSVER
jgi:hypothetical protein